MIDQEKHNELTTTLFEWFEQVEAEMPDCAIWLNGMCMVEGDGNGNGLAVTTNDDCSFEVAYVADGQYTGQGVKYTPPPAAANHVQGRRAV